jgi:heme A synthase
MKPWWSSRTLWLNAVAVALVALEAQFGVLQPLLPVNLYAAVAVVLPVANAVLRLLTSTAIAMRPGEASGDGDGSR